MIIQGAAADGSRLAITLDQHLQLADQACRAFGNAAFALPVPADLLSLIVRHHDAGWADEDRAPSIDSRTGLPCSLDELPTERWAAIATRSIEQNLARHAWCGLLVSLHYASLLDDRDAAFVATERARQLALRDGLARDPATRAWTEPGAIERSLGTLQFFDALAVWLQLRGPDGDERWTFAALPRRDRSTARISAVARGRAVAMEPWPFAARELAWSFRGRRAVPGGDGRYPLDADDTVQTIRVTPVASAS